MARKCPFEDEIIKIIEMRTTPICFHCGRSYIRDLKHSGPSHNTWKPNCKCLSTSMVRIVTGNGVNIENDENY